MEEREKTGEIKSDDKQKEVDENEGFRQQKETELNDLKEYFAAQLNEIMTTKKLTNRTVSNKSGIDPKKINHWRNALYLPRDPLELIALAQALNVSIDQLFGHKPDNEEKLESKKDNLFLENDGVKAKIAYHAALSRVTENADVIWFLFRTGVTLSEWTEREVRVRQRIKDKNKNPPTIRVLLCTPGYNPDLNDEEGDSEEELKRKDYGRQAHFWATHFTGIRRDDWDSEPETVSTHVKSTVRMFEGYIREAEKESQKKWRGNLEIRALPYLPSTVCHIVNPGTGNGKAVFILFNFQKDFYVSPFWEISEAEDKALFDWFVEDYNRHWNWEESYSIRNFSNAIPR